MAVRPKPYGDPHVRPGPLGGFPTPQQQGIVTGPYPRPLPGGKQGK